ncbi:MAG: NAD(P)/FAD-dependent oxidoreductase [Candidatus Saccharibacteria bacterium]|nr:NAD(P)/FAD-dependent oxidoreductase [Moraxellaceae bacterium]
MSSYDVIIIGAGASGLMCASHAGQRGRRVLVLDSSNKVGKKILMSGGGRCNMTNLFVEPGNFISNNPHFCISALNRYTQWDFIAMVEKYKIPYHERKHGQLFCNDSAKDILNMLLAECEKVNVTIKTNCEVTQITAIEGSKENPSARFKLTSNQGTYFAESLVIASGGLSIPTLGASGFGYDVAKQFGHTVLPLRAGLVPFTFTDGFKAVTERLSGIAVDGTMSSDTASFSEAILFTHRGISGPAALQVSNYWDVGESITMDLFPTEEVSELADWLKQQKQQHPKSLLRTLLYDRLVKSLVLELQTLLWENHAETAMGQMPDTVLDEIAHLLKNWSQKPSGTEGYRTAEVTLGGVDTAELSSKTMESKKQTGLYFIGEVVDVSGHLGGFNFQWAWASGHAAAQFV